MSFDYTDEQLNNFNWGKNVYSVNEDYVNRHQQDKIPPLLVVDKDSKDLLYNETNIITPDDQMSQVIKTYSDPVTGFDGMAVAPIIDGQPDYNSIAVIAAATAKNHLLVSVLVQMLVITQTPSGIFPKGALFSLALSWSRLGH